MTNPGIDADDATMGTPPTPRIRRKSAKSITMRLEFELSRPNANSYSEFNYAKELEKKQEELLKEINNNESNSDAFIQKETDVAKQLQQKSRAFGHCDIGMGYDDSDSFIDNTDIYDEIIPQGVDTVRGGFYINGGALEFKQVQQPSAMRSTDKEMQKATPSASKFGRKRPKGTKKTVPVKTADDHQKKRKTSRSASGSNSSQLPDATGNVSNLEPMHPNATTVKNLLSDTFPWSKLFKNVMEEQPQSDSEKCIEHQPKRSGTTRTPPGSSSSQQLPDITGLDNTGLNPDEETLNQNPTETVSISSSSVSSNDDGDSQGGDDSPTSAVNNEKSVKTLRTNDTILPELGMELRACIHKFMELVNLDNATDHRFSFSYGLDDIRTSTFLSIEKHLLFVEQSHRDMVFAHLEYQLMLPKLFLKRKAKQLQKLQSKRAYNKLRQAVTDAMYRVIANYKKLVLHKISENKDSQLPWKMPKKKFPWNSKLRILLVDVYECHRRSFFFVPTRTQNLDEYVLQYLKDDVAKLWPKGWMSSGILKKEIEKHYRMAKKAKGRKKEEQTSANNDASKANPVLRPIDSSTLIEDPPAGSLVNCDPESEASSNAPSCSMKKNSRKKKTTAKVTQYIINVDEFKSASDILMTSQNLINTKALGGTKSN